VEDNQKLAALPTSLNWIPLDPHSLLRISLWVEPSLYMHAFPACGIC